MSDWDIVLRGGRVIDPESGLDAIADVAIAGDRVAEVGPGLGPARAEADVTGLVVTAGFVDLHSHVNTVAGLRLHQAGHDGLQAVTWDHAAWGKENPPPMKKGGAKVKQLYWFTQNP